MTEPYAIEELERCATSNLAAVNGTGDWQRLYATLAHLLREVARLTALEGRAIAAPVFRAQEAWPRCTEIGGDGRRCANVVDHKGEHIFVPFGNDVPVPVVPAGGGEPRVGDVWEWCESIKYTLVERVNGRWQASRNGRPPTQILLGCPGYQRDDWRLVSRAPAPAAEPDYAGLPVENVDRALGSPELSRHERPGREMREDRTKPPPGYGRYESLDCPGWWTWYRLAEHNPQVWERPGSDPYGQDRRRTEADAIAACWAHLDTERAKQGAPAPNHVPQPIGPLNVSPELREMAQRIAAQPRPVLTREQVDAWAADVAPQLNADAIAHDREMRTAQCGNCNGAGCPDCEHGEVPKPAPDITRARALWTDLVTLQDGPGTFTDEQRDEACVARIAVELDGPAAAPVQVVDGLTGAALKLFQSGHAAGVAAERARHEGEIDRLTKRQARVIEERQRLYKNTATALAQAQRERDEAEAAWERLTDVEAQRAAIASKEAGGFVIDQLGAARDVARGKPSTEREPAPVERPVWKWGRLPGDFAARAVWSLRDDDEFGHGLVYCDPVCGGWRAWGCNPHGDDLAAALTDAEDLLGVRGDRSAVEGVGEAKGGAT